MRGTKLYAMLAAMFIAGAFLASPELRAYAANTVFSTDIKDGEVKTADLANNAVTSAKIKDGEVKTDDIAPSAIGSLRIKDNDVKAADIASDAVGADEIAKDAVGASEIKGVDKLIFAGCDIPKAPTSTGPGLSHIYYCSVPGMDTEDEVVANISSNGRCFIMESAVPISAETVQVLLTNSCDVSWVRSATHVSIIVYDELPDKVLP